MPAGRLRTVLWASLVVVLALLVAFAAWTNYTHSPNYSLAQLARAVADKDWKGVQKYVDVEAVVNQQVDTATTETFGDGDSWHGAVAAKVAEWAKPGLTHGAKDVLHAVVEMGPDRPNAAVDLAGLSATMSIKSVTRQGDHALVSLEAAYGNERAINVKLRMKRVDDYWRVIAIEDIAEAATRGRR